MQQHAEFKESPLGMKVMAACKTQVEPVVKELQELINGVWQNQSKVDESDEFLPRIVSGGSLHELFVGPPPYAM